VTVSASGPFLVPLGLVSNSSVHTKGSGEKIPLLLLSKEQLAADVVLMLVHWGWSAIAVFIPKEAEKKIPLLLLSKEQLAADGVLMLLHQTLVATIHLTF
jgi:hypothetical protein